MVKAMQRTASLVYDNLPFAGYVSRDVLLRDVLCTDKDLIAERTVLVLQREKSGLAKQVPAFIRCSHLLILS